tara:strand:+ start:2777 stop:2932 length:156 start_codon:yes stop_codon:yes gene_type:complete
MDRFFEYFFYLCVIAVLIFVGVYLAPSGRSSQKKEDNGSLEESFVNNMKYL